MTDRGGGSFAQFAASLVLIFCGTTRTPFTPSAYAGARKGSTAC
jgi:hypothetical protein